MPRSPLHHEAERARRQIAFENGWRFDRDNRPLFCMPHVKCGGG